MIPIGPILNAANIAANNKKHKQDQKKEKPRLKTEAEFEATIKKMAADL